jgi:hypothetical protein
VALLCHNHAQMRPRFRNEIKARVTDETRVRLEQMAAERQLAVSDLLREAVRYYLANRDPELVQPADEK